MQRSRSRTTFSVKKLTRNVAVWVTVLGTAAALTACGPAGDGGSGDENVTPVAGGTLRVGIAGNGTQETFDPTQANSQIDYAHVVQVYNTITVVDPEGNVQPSLASSITPNDDATSWTIELPEDVTFQDGQELSADDVVYTLNYNLDPDNASFGSSNLSSVDEITKVDDFTVQIDLSSPNSFFDVNLSDFHLGIFPDGFSDFDNPVGTGPFQVEEFDPGKEAKLTKFEDYKVGDLPYIDELVMVSIDETQARTSALSSGQVDVIADVAPTQVSTIEDAPNLRLNETQAAGWLGQYMQTSGDNAGALAEPKVRQALRLLVDREQIVSNVYLGHATVANDIYGWNDPSYPSDLPQREYDPEQAKQLLTEAGYENLTIDLYAGNLTAGISEISTLMAEQAKAGGVTINLQSQPADQYFSTSYMQQPFGSTYWSGAPLATSLANNMAPDASTNETAWNDPEWAALYEEALRTPDRDAANDLLRQAQEILHERGGYIIPVFPNYLDAYNSKVHGLKESPVYNLGAYDFTGAFIAS